eukprot:6476465-Amphidinium_carterae.4
MRFITAITTSVIVSVHEVLSAWGQFSVLRRRWRSFPSNVSGLGRRAELVSTAELVIVEWRKQPSQRSVDNIERGTRNRDSCTWVNRDIVHAHAPECQFPAY